MNLPFGESYTKMSNTKGFGYWEPPAGSGSRHPILDVLTQRAAGFLAAACESDIAFRGFHTTADGVNSLNVDFSMEIDGENWETNSLLVHYLAFYRSALDPEEVAKVAKLLSRVEPVSRFAAQCMALSVPGAP